MARISKFEVAIVSKSQVRGSDMDGARPTHGWFSLPESILHDYYVWSERKPVAMDVLEEHRDKWKGVEIKSGDHSFTIEKPSEVEVRVREIPFPG